MAVDPVVGLDRQWRAGRAQAAQPRQVGDARRLEARLHAAGEERRAGPEHGHAGIVDKAPQHAGVGPGRVAVIERDGGAEQQAGDLRVPHDPAAAAVPVEDVIRAEVVVERHQLELLDDDAAVAMHDRLGHAGGAGGIDDP
ncbi:hypothetical protein D9M72_473950 [compost metagenome]